MPDQRGKSHALLRRSAINLNDTVVVKKETPESTTPNVCSDSPPLPSLLIVPISPNIVV